MHYKFMLAAILLGTLVLPSGAQEKSTPGPHRQVLAMAGFADSEKPKVISFHADWCPACEQLKPALDKAEGRYGSQVDFISVNIDDEKNKDIVRLYRVHGVPEVVFVNPKGKVVSTFIGNEPKELKTGMQKLLNENTTTSIAAGRGSIQ